LLLIKEGKLNPSRLIRNTRLSAANVPQGRAAVHPYPLVGMLSDVSAATMGGNSAKQRRNKILPAVIGTAGAGDEGESVAGNTTMALPEYGTSLELLALELKSLEKLKIHKLHKLSTSNGGRNSTGTTRGWLGSRSQSSSAVGGKDRGIQLMKQASLQSTTSSGPPILYHQNATSSNNVLAGVEEIEDVVIGDIESALGTTSTPSSTDTLTSTTADSSTAALGNGNGGIGSLVLGSIPEDIAGEQAKATPYLPPLRPNSASPAILPHSPSRPSSSPTATSAPITTSKVVSPHSTLKSPLPPIERNSPLAILSEDHLNSTENHSPSHHSN
jgi:hypothetical protein